MNYQEIEAVGRKGRRRFYKDLLLYMLPVNAAPIAVTLMTSSENISRDPGILALGALALITDAMIGTRVVFGYWDGWGK